MPNPQDDGTFEQWITDRIDFKTGKPRSGNTGDMEQWITDRIDFSEYQTGEIHVPRPPAAYYDGPTIF